MTQTDEKNKELSDRNQELYAAFKNGDKSAIDEICRINIGMINNAVFKYGKGLEEDDARQYCYEYILDAIFSYDDSKGTKFSTWMNNKIRFGLLNVKGRADKNQIRVLLDEIITEYEMMHGRKPNDEELSQISGVSEKVINKALGERIINLSYDQITSAKDEDGYTMGVDIMSPDSYGGIDQKLIDEKEETEKELFMRRVLGEYKSIMTEMEFKILCLSVVDNKTSKMIADELNTSEVCVNQLQKRINRRIKYYNEHIG